MKIILEQIAVATTEPIQLIDITADVEACSRETGLRDGLVTLISPHTTAHINLNEREEMLQRDMVKYLSDLVPQRRRLSS